MKLKLSSVGNPDHRQDPDKKLYDCDPNTTIDVDSFEMASAHCRQFIEKNDLGGGNWSGGDIYKNRKLIAYVSYNGRVWKVGEDGKKYTHEEEIDLDMSLVVPTVFKFMKKEMVGQRTVYYYRDQKRRHFIFSDMKEQYMYKIKVGTAKGLDNSYTLENFIDIFIVRRLRKESIKTIEIIL